MGAHSPGTKPHKYKSAYGTDWHDRAEQARAYGEFVSDGHWNPHADRRNEQDLENESHPHGMGHNLHYDGPVIKHKPVVATGFEESKYACKDGKSFVQYDDLCDGKKDCEDGSDEYTITCKHDKINGKGKPLKMWSGETPKKWHNRFTPPMKTNYNMKQSKQCCVNECKAMKKVIKGATKQDVADCKMGCGMWLASSSLNYESRTWWPQLHHKCQKQCGAAQAYQAFREKCEGNKESPECRIDPSFWEQLDLSPDKIKMCKNGCDSFLGCMKK